MKDSNSSALKRTACVAAVLVALLGACGGKSGGGHADANAGLGEAGADVDASKPSGGEGSSWRPLIDHNLWESGPLDNDPLAEEQPDTIDCDIAAWLVERGELELDTGRCNYFWLTQEALHPVAQGDTLSLQLRHFDLTAAEPSRAHVALSFGDGIEWQTRIDIPHDAQVLNVEWSATRALKAGERVGLHLHNHGQNTWTLVTLQVEPAAD